MLTRRDLLIRSACLAAALPAARLAAALPAPRKLKTIMIHPFHVLPENATETYRALEGIGYTEMEETNKDIELTWSAVQATTLKKVSVEGQAVALLAPGKEDELSQFFDQVKKWGFPYVGMSYSDPGEGTYLEKYRIFADRFNKAGEKAHAAGLTALLYHNTPFGFKPENGTFGHQVVWDNLDKKLCAIELDVYWASLAGHDPADILQTLSGRVKVIHMKDKPANLPTMYDHAPGPGNFLDVGDGVINWAAVLRAGQAAGVEHYSVEPDVTNAAQLVVQARKSFDYLSKLEF
jgi:sugar phosphate isomerase/epimerase